MSGPLAVLLLLFSEAGAVPITSQIRISLFGQPCILQGPFDSKVLREIHSISPEEIYPDAPGKISTLDQAKKALEKVRVLKTLPTPLISYRDRLTRRLEAQLAIFTALRTFKKDRKLTSLLATSKYLSRPEHQKTFEASLRSFGSEGHPPENATTRILTAYNDGIESNPEEEFHRAIRRLKVEYHCAFEEDEEEDEAAD